MMLLVALGPLNLGVADSCGLSFQPTQEFPPNASEHETRTYVNLFLITQVQLYRRLQVPFKRLDESYKRRILYIWHLIIHLTLVIPTIFAQYFTLAIHPDTSQFGEGKPVTCRRNLKIRHFPFSKEPAIFLPLHSIFMRIDEPLPHVGVNWINI